jgi:hypothetical protein
MVFCFVQKYFFGQHELEYLFFPEFNIGLYDKNSESKILRFSDDANIDIDYAEGIPPPPIWKRITFLRCMVQPILKVITARCAE